MSKICFAVLAHDHRDCIEDLIKNLYHFEPDCHIVLFNGGTDPTMFHGLNAHHCPYSTPMKYRRPQISTIWMMRWVIEQQLDFDYFVLVDHDMLLIKHGFSSFLDKYMKNSEYLGLLKGERGKITPDLKWRPGQRFLKEWNTGWSEVFGISTPYGCFNPGQVFRRSYVERFLNYPKFNDLIHLINQSSLSSLGEIIFTTMAHVLVSNPRRMPYHDSAIRYRKPHSSQDVKFYLNHGNIYLIHPVPMEYNTQIRQFVRFLMEGKQKEAWEMNWKVDDVKYDYKPYRKKS